MAREIQLTRGYVAIVDDADFGWLSQWKWNARPANQADPRWYAYRCAYDPTRKGPRTVAMHRVVLEAQRGQIVDHVNGDGLDNRRENLRICTASQSAANRCKHKADKRPGWGRGPYKGVYIAGRRWRAIITVSGTQTHLGYFAAAEDAALAYDAAAVQHFGEFALLNFPEEAA